MRKLIIDIWKKKKKKNLTNQENFRVNHSKNAIVKTQKKPEKEVDDTMRKVLEAQAKIASKYNPGSEI